MKARYVAVARHAVALLCAAAVAGCGGGGGGAAAPPTTPAPAPTANAHHDWATFGYDATRSGKNPNETLIGTANVGSLRLHWSYATAGAITAQPVVAANVAVAGTVSDVLYVGDEAGAFYALNAATGALIWKRQFAVAPSACADLPSWGITSTAVIDRALNSIYVVDGQGAVHGLDLATGNVLPAWPAAVPVVRNASLEYVYSALTLTASGTLYAARAGYCDAGLYYGAVVALDAATGASTGTWIPQSLPHYGAGIWGAGGVVADPRPTVSDVYLTTGNAFPPDVTYGNSVVRLSAGLSPLAANAGFDAAVIDNDFGANPVTYLAAGCPPQLAVEQKSGMLDVYDLDTIAAGPVQQLRIGEYVSVATNVDAASYDAATNMLYIGNATPNAPYVQGLLAFAVVNCSLQLAWQEPGFGASPLSQPVIANGVVYYATGTSRTLAAYNASTGAPLWISAPLGGPVYAPPTVVNGMLYAASFDHHVYAYAP